MTQEQVDKIVMIDMERRQIEALLEKFQEPHVKLRFGKDTNTGFVGIECDYQDTVTHILKKHDVMVRNELQEYLDKLQKTIEEL